MSAFTDLQLRVLPRDGVAYPVELTLAGEQHTRGGLAADVLPWTSGPDVTTEGQRLFDALCADRVLRDAWIAARTASPQRRVRLWLDAPELHALPWELFHDGHTFLAAGGATPFSRYVPTNAPWGAPLTSPPSGGIEGGILVAIANPDDLDTYNLAPLDVAAERQVFSTDLTESNGSLSVPSVKSVESNFLPPPITLARIEAALRQGYTALHFVGHGVFSQKRQESALYLENAAGDAAVTSGADFAAMLARLAAPPRLVFLAACQSATPATSRAYLGLGVALVQAGVPAVIAMREAVAISAARALSRTFYARLAEHGQSDLALNEARSHLLTARHPDAAVPALWMRLRSGRLWEEVVTQASGLPQVVNQAMLVGDGALAQGHHNTVIGARGVSVGGKVGGSIITGD